LNKEVGEEKRTSVSSTELIQKMRIEVDTSDYVSRRVSYIECKDGK